MAKKNLQFRDLKIGEKFIIMSENSEHQGLEKPHYIFIRIQGAPTDQLHCHYERDNAKRLFDKSIYTIAPNKVVIKVI